MAWLVITKVALLAPLAVLDNAARVRRAVGRMPVLRWAGPGGDIDDGHDRLAAALSQTA